MLSGQPTVNLIAILSQYNKLKLRLTGWHWTKLVEWKFPGISFIGTFFSRKKADK